MKVSRYNVKINDIGEEDYGILYNTLSRRYVVYDKHKEKLLIDTFENMNQRECSLEEIKIIDKALKAGLVIKDSEDEIGIIRFNEGKRRYHHKHISLMLLPSIGCNLKYVYCYENTTNKNINDNTEEKILKFIDNESKKFNSLRVSWLLDDSLVEFDRVKNMSVKIKNICKKNNCEYEEDITSNGYEFTNEIVEKIKSMSISRISIIINSGSSDEKKLKLKFKENFQDIYENISRLLRNDIAIFLRCNIDNKNYGKVLKLFEMIPKEYREFITISLGNMQCEINFYYLYKGLIDRGYKYTNNYSSCESCFKNMFTVYSSGKLMLQASANGIESELNELKKNGDEVAENFKYVNKLELISIFDNEECLKCIELPLCVDSCKLGKLNEPKKCACKGVEGLELRECILLEYYYDKKRNLIEDKVI